mmetsp:Transcript_49802/g.111942  ORF Transcript_49802/g.111942 Transcript_49802/m.111942 type:complete len:410 (-) Transcript_49802:36-1265(-)
MYRSAAQPTSGRLSRHKQARKRSVAGICSGLLFAPVLINMKKSFALEAPSDVMPLLKQKGPSCGSTCLAMCLEYLGLPCDPDIIEHRIHPYGSVDLGELPSELARFARFLGFDAKHYSHGTLDQLDVWLQKGCAVIVMLNYQGGTGHLVVLLGFEKQNDQISAVRIRNPWGYDESIPVNRFLREWCTMRQSRTDKVGRWLPVFDAGYAVLTQMNYGGGNLPVPSLCNWLHSAPVDLLVASANGVGGSLSTMSNGHWAPGFGQLLGNVFGTIGGVMADAIGDLIGLNLEFCARELSNDYRLGHVVRGLGWLVSMAGGLLAGAVRVLRLPLVHLGELCAGRDALREAVMTSESSRLRTCLCRLPEEQRVRQLHLLLNAFHTSGDACAADRLLTLGPCSSHFERRLRTNIPT